MKAKKTVCFGLLLAMLLSCCVFFTSCGAPEIDEIYDRVVELIEASYEVNTVFYGPGLPVYSRDSRLASIRHLYDDASHEGYEYVSEYSKFLTSDAVLSATEKVYSRAYIDSVLRDYAFTGAAYEDPTGHVGVSYARYLEDADWIYASSNDQQYELFTAMRIYDYSSMKIVSPSSSDSIHILIDSWLEDSPDAVEPIRLRLVRQGGDWYLDTFTGG